MTEENQETLDDGNEEKNYAFGKKFKYTLDSDEEDDEVNAEKYNVMNDDAIEGIEKPTIEYDGDIKITPFNMDEELESGHFDKEGTYIFKKENDIRDNWLDNIDWNRVIKPEVANKKRQQNESDEDDDDQDKELSEPIIKELYEQIVTLIQPGESIRKAIQRYGKICNTNKKGQKRKLNAKNDELSSDGNKCAEAREKMLRLTSIADRILHNGDMDIYEKTYEQFRLHLNKSKIPTLDMFGDDFDVKASSSSTTAADDSKTFWEYKWEDKEDAQIYGPYSSEDMLAWVNQGYFNQGVYVRRKGSPDAKFYSSKRIDFELYI